MFQISRAFKRLPAPALAGRVFGNAVLFIALLSLGKTAAWGATNVVVPVANTNVEGDSNNVYPLDILDIGLTAQRYQQLYAASEFPPTPGFITQIRFRPDAFFGRSFNAVLPNIRIALSVTPVTPATMSPIYANNFGSGPTIVFNGALALSSAFTGPSSGPKNFDVVINLATPFFYNPAQGNLLLEVRNFTGVITTLFDAVSSQVVNRVFNIDNDPNATAGILAFSTRGLVTEFVFNPCSTTLCIADYTLVSLQPAAGGRVYATYRADLVNTIAPPVPVLPPGTSQVTATLINLDPFKVRAVPGQDQLKFAANLTANSVTPSSNTFTVIVDPTSFDPNQLQWMFQIGPAPPVANPGPNQIVPVGSTVTVNGLGSSNASGIGGALTYSWTFISRPPGTMTRLFYETSAVPMFVADVPGTYVLSLTVSNGVSSSTATVTIVAR